MLKAAVHLKSPGLAEAIGELVTKAIGPVLAEHVGGERTIIVT